MFPLWAKLILILSLLPTLKVFSPDGSKEVGFGNSSVINIEQACIPMTPNPTQDCSKLFQCTASTSGYRIPIIYQVLFDVLMDNACVGSPDKLFEMKVLINVKKSAPLIGDGMIQRKNKGFTAQWTGSSMKVDDISRFQEIRIFIFLKNAAIFGQVALPTYSIFLCEGKNLTIPFSCKNTSAGP